MTQQTSERPMDRLTDTPLSEDEQAFDAIWDNDEAEADVTADAATDSDDNADDEWLDDDDGQSPDDQANPEDTGKPDDEEVQKAEHRLRSTEGRLRKFEEQLEAQRTELEQLRGKPAAQTSPDADDPGDSNQGENGDEWTPPGMDPDEWQAIKEDLPELAKTIEGSSREVSELKSQVGAITSDREAEQRRIQEAQQQEEWNAHNDKIRAAHDDYDAITQDMAPLQEFIAKQSPLQQRIYNEVVSNGSPDEIIDLLTTFKQSGKSPGNPKRPSLAVKTKRSRPSLSAQAVGSDDYDGAWDEAVKGR